MKILKIISGTFIMFGVFIPVYLIDRFITFPLIWLKTESLVSWLKDNQLMVHSIIRVLFALLIVGLVWVIF